MRTYAGEMASTNVRTNCFSPGATRTKMRATAMPGEDPMTLPTPEEVFGPNGAHVPCPISPTMVPFGSIEPKGLFKQFAAMT